MSKIIRYGKENILDLKSGFFDGNDPLRENLLQINAVYAAQPLRGRCKICDENLPDDSDFMNHGVAYVICSSCGHLNGRHEDTSEFCTAIYSNNGGSDYGKNYTSGDRDAYQRRVREVYVPKARFLGEVLSAQALPADMHFADLGAGAGYFVSALQHCGYKNVVGYEVSESQIEFAQHMNPQVKMVAHELDEICSLANSVKAEAISLIGVLEHLREPKSVLNAICSNPNVHYLYLSVPLFSPCVVFEALFPAVMPRQLAGGHTHLFSEASLAHMANEFGLDSIGEWWFGADMMDMFRNIIVQLGKTQNAGRLQDFAADSFLPVIDDLQLAMDKKHLSSEVHIVFKIRR